MPASPDNVAPDTATPRGVQDTAEIARNVPAASDILCEGCGYTLNGLPEDSRCPECGKPIILSIAAGRCPTAWDRSRTLRTFLATTFHATFRPAHFYKTLATRGPVPASHAFARWHWAISAILLAYTGAMHFNWYVSIATGAPATSSMPYWLRFSFVPLLIVATYAMLAGTTAIAARLTTWEATYRGYRLPIEIVKRGLYYHAAHYIPVAVVACATVFGFLTAIDRGWLGVEYLTTYLYVLSAEVIAAAMYLFLTYWAGMRNMMFANA